MWTWSMWVWMGLASGADLRDVCPLVSEPGPEGLAGEDLWKVELPAGVDTPRCADGSNPVFYVDKARDAAGTPIESDSWVFFFQGGGSCWSADGCLDAWAREPRELSSTWARDSIEGVGILDPSDGAFHGYNRVRINKCTYDRFMGNETQEGWEATPIPALLSCAASPATFDIHFHGRRITEAVIDVLASPLTYSDCSGAVCSDVTLPGLSEASQVLLTGNSGGARGLVMNGDDLRTQIVDLTPGFVDVRLVIDAAFEPSAPTEAGAPYARGSSFSEPYSEIYAGMIGGTPYDAEPLYASGLLFERDVAWGTILDESCVAADPTATWRCRDHLNVLFNYVQTPYFVRQDLSDSNSAHLGGGWNPPWLMPVMLGGSAADYQNRVRAQAWALRFHALYAADPLPRRPSTFLPDCGQHVGLINHDGWNSDAVSLRARNITFQRAVEFWASSTPPPEFSLDSARTGALCPP